MKDERIRLQIKKRLKSLFAGEFKSAEKETRGYDFRELKPMRLGDDPRGFDVRSRALRGEFYLRIREPERAANIYLLIDSSRSVSFSSTTATKWAVELEIASLLANATLSGMNRVALIFFGNAVEKFYELQSNREIVNAALKTAEGNKPNQRNSSLKEALRFVTGLSENRGTKPNALFIISDFLFGADYEHLLADISKNTDVLAFVVSDPREKGWRRPKFSVVSFEDLESGRIGFAKETADTYGKLPGIFKRHEIDYAFFATCETPQERLRRLIELFEQKLIK